MEVFPSIEDLRMWADRLEEVQKRLAPYFERAEPRQRAMAYIRGLLSTTERKNGWQLAEVAGARFPCGEPTRAHTPERGGDHRSPHPPEKPIQQPAEIEHAVAVCGESHVLKDHTCT